METTSFFSLSQNDSLFFAVAKRQTTERDERPSLRSKPLSYFAPRMVSVPHEKSTVREKGMETGASGTTRTGLME